MSGFLKCGVQHLLYIYGFRFQAFYSTVAATSHTKFMVQTLVNSLGFSKEEAISISSKVSRSKPRQYKPVVIFNFFEQQVGLDKTQIKKVVSSVPALLLSDVDRHLKPKIGVLQELNLSVSQLVRIITNTGNFFSLRGDCDVTPKINYLRELLGNNELIVKIITKHSMLLTYNLHETMPPNVSLLHNLGFSIEDIEKLLLWNPRILTLKPESLKDIIDRVEKTFRISRNCRMFLHGIYALSWIDESTVERRLEIFRSFGWSDSDIFTLVQKLPVCLSRSEAKIRNVLSFLMKELGYESCYLASHPAFFTYSLERRILPRYELLKLLNEKKLIKGGLKLYSVVCVPDSKFLERYVLPLKAEVPEVYDLFYRLKVTIGSN